MQIFSGIFLTGFTIRWISRGQMVGFPGSVPAFIAQIALIIFCQHAGAELLADHAAVKFIMRATRPATWR